MISARNQIDVSVDKVEVGKVNTHVVLTMDQGTTMEASITNHGAESLALKTGERVIAFFKASHVLVATGWAIPISARNILKGVVGSIVSGVVNAEISIELLGGDRVIATITNEAVKNLALTEGVEVMAIFKASDVMLAKIKM